MLSTAATDALASELGASSCGLPSGCSHCPASAGESISQATGCGWSFGASTTTPGVTGLPASETTGADGTGTVTFTPGFGTNEQAAVTVGEVQHPGYELVTQGGRNAVCTDLDTGAEVPVRNTAMASGPGFTVDVPRQDAVSCTVYNRAAREEEPADVTVDKVWDVEGGATRRAPSRTVSAPN
ncbi:MULTISPECIES: hypothetical protein [Streptomyces]|uniref:hypothetical protein n=1 Tax=Streptomyces TaxID=1883 RepID=UPI0016036DC8|nr:hypothetical protein [Streptomyces murinus]MBA9043283.1 hypothetical protein [Streptomyces murinus]